MELPSGWARTTVGDLLKLRYGKALELSARGDGLPIPVVASAGIMTGTTTPLVSEPVVVIGRKGNVGSIQLFETGCWPIDTVFYATIPAGIEPRYLAHQLFEANLKTLDSSTATPSLRREDLESVVVAIAPLAEQCRIVETLEDHLSRLDAGNQYIARVRASTTLFDIARRRELLGPWLSSTRKLKTLLASPLINGRSVPTADEGFPVLRLTAIKQRVLDLSARKGGAWRQEDAAPFLVKRGDFMVGRGNGSLHLVGRGALVIGTPDPVAFPDTMIRIRPDSQVINPEFLAFVWDSRVVRRQVESAARTTAGIYKVNQGMLEGLDVPVPPLCEQERIVQAASVHFAGVNRLVEAIDVAGRRSEHLRRAVLLDAFSGRLLPQDSADQPAAILLKQIETERVDEPKPRRRQKAITRTVMSPPTKTKIESAGIQEELPL